MGGLRREQHRVCDLPAKETFAQSNRGGTSDQPELRDRLPITRLGIFKSDKVVKVKRRPRRFTDSRRLGRHDRQTQGLVLGREGQRRPWDRTGRTSVGSKDETVVTSQRPFPDFDGCVGLGRRESL